MRLSPLPVLFLSASLLPGFAAPLKICATTPDAGSLVRELGADGVEVTVFCKGPEDPHYVTAKPGFVKRLSEADLFVQVGAELEIGYAPVLLEGSRNIRLRPGQDGFLDLSEGMPLLDIPTGPMDRSMGDVHPGGNPHYLLDPANGLRAAEAIANRLAKLRPDQAEAVHGRLKAFRLRLGSALVGADLAGKLSPVEVAEAARQGTLPALLSAKGVSGSLGGWMAALAPYAGTAVAGDHNMYVYFTHRFGLRMHCLLEPKPGVPPSSKHLAGVVKEIPSGGVKSLLVGPYFAEKPIDFVVRHTGVCVARLAHQTGGRPEAVDYLAMCDGNVRAVLTCLSPAKVR